jgi:RNA polymerase primary sigma factor
MDLSRYYEEICREPILTKDEELAVMAIYKNPSSSEKERQRAKDRIIRANLRFVFKQAKKYSRNDPSKMDVLISAGNEGLLIGLEKFDPRKKKRFLTYAGWWVIQRILKEMSQMRIVSLPIWKQQLASKIARLKMTNPKITVKEISAMFPKLSEKDITELFDTSYLTYYIDDLDEGALEAEGSLTSVEKSLDIQQLHDIIYSLPSPHKDLIIAAYGIEDGVELSTPRLSRRFILTRDQIKQLKKEALEMIRERLSDDPKRASSSSLGPDG